MKDILFEGREDGIVELEVEEREFYGFLKGILYKDIFTKFVMLLLGGVGGMSSSHDGFCYYDLDSTIVNGNSSIFISNGRFGHKLYEYCANYNFT